MVHSTPFTMIVTAMYSVVQHGMAWCCVVRCGMVWCGVVWHGKVWYGMVWCGMVLVHYICVVCTRSYIVHSVYVYIHIIYIYMYI